jgi:hypothetical protein
MTKPWHYLENQFLNETEDSFKKAVKLCDYHDHELKRAMDDDPLDPDWATLYNRHHPLKIALTNEYNAWKSSGGSQESQTLNVKQLLKLMAGKVNNWDRRSQDFYADTTPRYKEIWPDLHKPFYGHGIEDRINAVNQLSINIGTDPVMITIKGEVDTYFGQLDTARTVQDGAKGAVKVHSTAVNFARIEAMTMQYGDMGFLMNKFYQNPTLVRVFHDVETLTDPDQTIWRGHLDALEVHPVLIHTFLNDDQMRVKITGDADATVYLATTEGGTDSAGLVITAHHERLITISDFGVGSLSTHRYLTIVNNSNTTETRFLVELY